MIKKFLPVVCLVVGLGAGIGTGVFMTSGAEKGHSEPNSEEKKQKKAEGKPAKSKADTSDKKDKTASFEYLRLTKQFVVPVVQEDEISALVTMSLSLETSPGITEAFYAIEPKLRDRFLQVLFDHANTGGFDGTFTQSDNLSALRKALLEVARKDLGDDVSRVLIMSVSRQDT